MNNINDPPIHHTFNFIHYLAYHNKINQIKAIDIPTLSNMIIQRNIDGDTICHIAAKLKNMNLIKLCIKIFPEIIYELNSLHYTPLFYLIDDIFAIKQIIYYYQKLKRSIRDHSISNQYYMIEYYLLHDHLQFADYLASNVIINKNTDMSLFTIIGSEKSESNKIEAIKILMKYHIDINVWNQEMLNPLITSLHYQNYQVAIFLLENGANPNYYGPENSDHPLSLAIIANDSNTINSLLKTKINVNVVDKYLNLPAHYLFLIQKDICFDSKCQIIDSTSNINHLNCNLDSVFSLLLQNDDWKKYKNILSKKKINIYAKNRDDVYPIDYIDADDLKEFMDLIYDSYIYQLSQNDQWSDPIDQKISTMIRNGEKIDQYKYIILKKINYGISYPQKNHSPITFKIISTPNTNLTNFSAYTHNYICFLYYILNKYSEVKIPFCSEQNNYSPKKLYNILIQKYQNKTSSNHLFRTLIREYINHSPNLIHHLIIWKNNREYFISPFLASGVQNVINKYPNTQYIILKITILTDQNLNHANLILIDLKQKVIERFDAYGNTPFYYHKDIDQLLGNFFADHFGELEYITPEKTSDGISFQVFSDEKNKYYYTEHDPKGFCVAWCLWYIEMRIKNYHLIPKSLIKKSIIQINKREPNFKEYIRNYSNYLDIEKNKIFKKANIPEKYWYAHHMPISIYKAYLKYIRNILDQKL